MRSVWANARYDSSEYGTKLLDKLLGGASFTFPKSLWAVYDCVWATTQSDKNAIIMDFFSGSATTAHAVMQINSIDDGKRKYIMVQLPEDLDKALIKATDEKTKKSIKSAIDFLDNIKKPHTICEIGKERIRRAGAKIEAEKAKDTDLFAEEPNQLDIGFRVFKLDSTNMKDVYYSAGEYKQSQLEMFTSNVKKNRSDMDLLYGCLLDWHVSLSLPYNQEKISGQTVHFVNKTDLVACFDENVSKETICSIAGRKPLRVVFRDASFKDSADKINVTEIFKAISPETTVKVI
jgi:adenine-specific DNA-methyltransferase